MRHIPRQNIFAKSLFFASSLPSVATPRNYLSLPTSRANARTWIVAIRTGPKYESMVERRSLPAIDLRLWKSDSCLTRSAEKFRLCTVFIELHRASKRSGPAKSRLMPTASPDLNRPTSSLMNCRSPLQVNIDNLQTL